MRNCKESEYVNKKNPASMLVINFHIFHQSTGMQEAANSWPKWQSC